MASFTLVINMAWKTPWTSPVRTGEAPVSAARTASGTSVAGDSLAKSQGRDSGERQREATAREPAAKPLAGRVQPREHRAARAGENSGRLLGRTAIEVTEDDSPPQPLGQAIDFLIDDDGDFVLLDIGGRHSAVLSGGQFGSRLQGAGNSNLIRDPNRDAVQPTG